jgi:hypothetical protein
MINDRVRIMIDIDTRFILIVEYMNSRVVVVI